MRLGEIFTSIITSFNRKTQELEVRCRERVVAEIFYKKLAIDTAINLISNILSLAEFKTFEKGKEVRKDNYYLFNYEPNKNQNANRFWRKVIRDLVYNNKVLIINHNDEFYAVDDFEKETKAFKENIYKNIQIGDLKLYKTFREEQVIYLELHSENMRNLIDGLYDDYGKLIEYSKNNYKRSNAMRGTLEIPTSLDKTPEGREKLSRLLNEHMRTFFTSETGAVLPLDSGLKYTDLTNSTYNNKSDSTDIRRLVDDVFDYTAIAFQIPPQMLKGNISDNDKSFDSFMAQCMRPIAELLEKEINRKYYKKDAFLEKSYMRIDTSMIKTMNLKDLATTIDLLTRSGVNTIDDNLKLLGREEIGGELGQKRYMTLNLEEIDEASERGEENKKQD